MALRTLTKTIWVGAPDGTMHPYDRLDGDELLSVTPTSRRPRGPLPDSLAMAWVLTAGCTRPPVAALPSEDPSRDLNLYAGTIFGRDSLSMAAYLDRIPDFRGILLTTILHHAARQGLTLSEHIAAARAELPALSTQGVARLTDEYRRRAESRGAIVHEDRDPATDAVARDLATERGWAWPYFNTADAPILFAKYLIRMALEDPRVLDLTVVQRDGQTRTLGQALRRSLDFCLLHMDNPEGLYEVVRSVHPFPAPAVAEYPTWMDSMDANTRKDGSLAQGPLTLAEVQADMYDVLVGLARFGRRHPGKRVKYRLGRPRVYRGAARRMRSSWLRLCDLGADDHVAYASERLPDGTVVPLDVRMSNVGRLLNSEMLSPSMLASDPSSRRIATAIIRQIYDPAQGMVTPTGVRTMSALEVHFQGGGYHNGSSWTHDNSLIADGALAQGHLLLAHAHHSIVVRTIERLGHYAEMHRGDPFQDPTENTAVIRVLSHDPGFGEYERTALQLGQSPQGWSMVFYEHSRRRLLEIENIFRTMAESGHPYQPKPDEVRLVLAIHVMIASAPERPVAFSAGPLQDGLSA